MMKPKISVIVPIYNAEKDLNRCLNSILTQTFTDFEVLLINDGSTDSSGSICDKYALLDSRIRVFHKNNGGVSSARNYGIENMMGYYSIHVDSDDWIEPKMLNLLYSKSQEGDYDIVTCNYRKIEIDSSVDIYYSMSGNKGSDLFKDLLLNNTAGSCWNKLIRNSLYIENNISFPKNIDFGEDWYVNCCTAFFARRVASIDNILYNYCQNEDSIMHNLNKTDYIGRFHAVELLVKKLKLDILNPLILNYVFNLKIECYNANLFSLREINSLSKNYNMHIKQVTLSNKHKLISYGILRKSKFILFLYAIMKFVKHGKLR